MVPGAIDRTGCSRHGTGDGQRDARLGLSDHRFISWDVVSFHILVQAIIAGTGFEQQTLAPTEVDASCDHCGAPTAITYENAYVYQVCTECSGGTIPGDEHPDGLLVGWTFEPTGLSDRTAEEVFAASTIKTFARIALRFENICPECSGPVEWSLDICDEHEPAADGHCSNCGTPYEVTARETCTVCKSRGFGNPGIKLLFHPAVVSFFYRHGIEVGFTGSTDFADVVRTMTLVEEFEEEVVSTDPVRVRVTVTHEDDGVSLLLDEEVNVIEVSGVDGHTA
ncbi:MAG: hypothetical protein V5A55_07605 [Halovenus sp.]